MRTAQLLLFFLLAWCQTTESLTDKCVNLGENVTLDCQIDVKEIYWVFQKLTDSPVLILRTFTAEYTSSHVQDQRLKDKYSGLTRSRLFISNITVHELGIYYCAKLNKTLQISNGTRLHTNESAQDQKQTEGKHQEQPCEKTFHEILTVTSILMNIVLIIAIIGLLQIKLQACKKRHQQCQDEKLEHLYSTNAEEFSEVEFRLFHPTNNTFVPFQSQRQDLDKYNQE
ncbi:uncharacterized protein LOC131529761 [Onychostoma macrolepis]|uniref:Immunoglobulin domain-containing protein n=1 Tax=Onychostoma macrolepis TaxID=369639 RepID=A0A7J6BR81_9TELE|nr:uncharacterized protein LOC131529761 [Onychostoma macrolepis]KAF4097530.1 hypothetical protein G5714_021538 [Onychostoma macrolepis]